MIIKKIFLLSFVLIYNFLFSQNSSVITFNIKGEIFAPLSKEDNFINKVSTIRADIQLEEGKFSILLIDYNKNGVFTDYRGCCRDIGSDGIIIMDYKEIKKKYFT